MHGAVRPPFVSVSDFERMPFHYCDRWCERCSRQQTCIVFAYEQNEHEKECEGEDCAEVVRLSGEQLSAAMSILVEKIKQVDAKIAEQYQVAESEPYSLGAQIYKSAVDLVVACSQLLKKLDYVPASTDIGSLLEQRQVISHYMFVVPTKLWRAAVSATESSGESWLDARASGYTALRGLMSIEEALIHIRQDQALRAVHETCKRLANVGVELSLAVRELYELEAV